MNLNLAKRIGALVAGMVLAVGCGGSSDNGGGDDGDPTAEGLQVTVVLPAAYRNGGPTGFGTEVSGIGVYATLDGVAVAPDEVRWAIKDFWGLGDAPGAVAPSAATGATTGFTVPDYETVRAGANAWLNRLYLTAGTDHEFDYVQAPNREQLLSFGAQQVQAMSFQVIATVRKGDHTATGSALVSPVTVAGAANPRPLGMMVVGNGASTGTYAWTLKYLPTTAAAGATFGNPPAGVTLQGADTRNPWVVPTATGFYQLQNGTGTPITFRVSTYHGTGRADSDEGADGVACADCHGPTEHGDYTLPQFAEWAESAHGQHEGAAAGVSLFQFGLDGGMGREYQESCVSCHVVGYSKVPTAQNHGFDDLARDASPWSFPVPAAGNFAALPADLKHRAGVQCESCHGPLEPTDHAVVAAVGYGTVAPVASMDAGICMSCHDGLTDGEQGPQWAASGHANNQLAIDDASIEYRQANAAHCGRCHAGEGFALYLVQQQAATGQNPGNIARPTTCTASSNPYCVCTGDPATCAPPPGNVTCTPRPGYAGPPYDPLCPCKPAAGQTTCSADAFMAAYLASKGMSAADIHGQSCQTCHEPHSAALRVRGDTKRTAGYFEVKNAGAGALCIVCHNSRGGAVRQGTFVLGNWTAPHTASQGDVYAGRNAFFMTEAEEPGRGLVASQAADSLPWASPHTATADACVTCHMSSVPEDLQQQYLISTSNHTFRGSMEGCQNCHSTADVTAFEARKEAIEAKLHTLDARLANAFKTRLNAAGFDAGTRYDYETDASLTAPADPTIDTAVTPVTTVELYESHGAPSVKLTLSDGTRFGTTLANIKGANASSTLFTVASGTSPNFVAEGDQNLARAYYNYLLIEGDGTEGVHNFPFAEAVLDNTIATLPAVP